jgi:hypothetical protein
VRFVPRKNVMICFAKSIFKSGSLKSQKAVTGADAQRKRIMTRDQAIELARRFAKAKPQGYYSEPFQPHEWVIVAAVYPDQVPRVVELAVLYICSTAQTQHE